MTVAVIVLSAVSILLAVYAVLERWRSASSQDASLAAALNLIAELRAELRARNGETQQERERARKVFEEMCTILEIGRARIELQFAALQHQHEQWKSGAEKKPSSARDNGVLDSSMIRPPNELDYSTSAIGD